MPGIAVEALHGVRNHGLKEVADAPVTSLLRLYVLQQRQLAGKRSVGERAAIPLLGQLVEHSETGAVLFPELSVETRQLPVNEKDHSGL
jgi:hypothetical protein